mgnify:FL=1
MMIDYFSLQTHIQNPLISLLEYYRESELPTQDELLLQSSGPVTDLAQKSFLPCLESIRILFFEPHTNKEKKSISELNGDINLGFNES